MNHTPYDLFCAAALQGLLAGRNPQAEAYSTAEVARVSVECADQMMLAIAASKAKSTASAATPAATPTPAVNTVTAAPVPAPAPAVVTGGPTPPPFYAPGSDIIM